jgi:hypothetical protein
MGSGSSVLSYVATSLLHPDENNLVLHPDENRDPDLSIRKTNALKGEIYADGS